MDIIDVIAKAQGGQALANLARTYKLSPEQVEGAVRAVVPELAWRMERNTLSRGGLADLVQALGHGHHEQMLDNPATLADPRLKDEGNRILGNILGSRDASRGVVARAASTSGLSESLIRMLLPIIASWVMGGLAKQSKGGLGDILAKLPHLPGAGGAGDGVPPAPRGGQIGGARGASVPMPAPRNGGGDRLPEQSRLPMPGETIPGVAGGGGNPYGDLSDILRRGVGPGGVGGGLLWRLVRNLLGGALGFGGRGVMSWFVRLIFVRFGWRLLRGILGR